MKINVLGTYKFVNKISFQPHKRCLNCPFFEDYLGWCKYLKIKIDNWDYYEKCPVIEITIEEE